MNIPASEVIAMNAIDMDTAKKTTYQEMVNAYRKRQHDTVVDAIAMGLTYLDEVAVETGLLDEVGILPELAGTVTAALPFAVIAVTEGSKVILGKKTGQRGLRDGAARMLKSGVAVGVGAAVTTMAGFWAAVPVTMGVRAMFDRYRSNVLVGKRVQNRISRLREIQTLLKTSPPAAESAREEMIPLPEHAVV